MCRLAWSRSRPNVHASKFACIWNLEAVIRGRAGEEVLISKLRYTTLLGLPWPNKLKLILKIRVQYIKLRHNFDIISYNPSTLTLLEWNVSFEWILDIELVDLSPIKVSQKLIALINALSWGKNSLKNYLVYNIGNKEILKTNNTNQFEQNWCLAS